MKIKKAEPEILIGPISNDFEMYYKQCLLKALIDSLKTSLNVDRVTDLAMDYFFTLNKKFIKEANVKDLRKITINLLMDKATRRYFLLLLDYSMAEEGMAINNYHINEDFYNMIKDLDLRDLKPSDLPCDQVGYVSMPIVDEDGHKYNGFYFKVGYKRFRRPKEDPDCDKKSLILGSCGTYIRSSCIDIEEDLPLESGFKKYKYTKNILSKTEVTDGIYSNWHRGICNVLAYIASGNPDLRSFRNSINYRSPGSTKVVKKDRDLSILQWNLVGYGWKKDPIYNTALWKVSAHTRRQKVGKGRREVKLVFVKSHIKERQKTKG